MGIVVYIFLTKNGQISSLRFPRLLDKMLPERRTFGKRKIMCN